MAQKLFEEQHIQDIADAIRYANSQSETYTAAQMGSAVRALKKTFGNKQINANGVYNAAVDNVDGYGQVIVSVPSGGGETQASLVEPIYQGLAYAYIAMNGVIFYASQTNSAYLNFFEVKSNHIYALLNCGTIGSRRRASYFRREFSDFEQYLYKQSSSDLLIYDDGVRITPSAFAGDDTADTLAARAMFCAPEDGIVIYATDNTGKTCPACCIDFGILSMKPIEYIEANNNNKEYFSTRLKTTGHTYYELDFQVTSPPGGRCFGIYSSGQSDCVEIMPGGLYVHSGGASRSISMTSEQMLNRHKLKAYAGELFLDDVKITDISHGVINDSEILIFAAGGSSHSVYSGGCNIRIYGCKIWEGENLVRDFQPKKIDLIASPVLYDAITGNTYMPIGQLGLSSGPEVL